MPLPPTPQRPTPSVTKEIPVAQPAATTTQVLTRSDEAESGPTPISAPLPPPPAPTAPEPTGPVDGLPGLPAAPTVGPKSRRPRDRAVLAGRGLMVASLVLLEIGLLLGFRDAKSFWTSVPLWSGFATVAALLGVLAFVGRPPRTERAWKLAAAGLTGLAVFWVLVVLPVANTDRGFVLTAALGCLGAALWIVPGRRA